MRGGHVSPESQRWLLESLFQMPLEQTRSMGTSGTLSGTVNAMTQTKSKMVAKVFGDTNQDLVFKPFVPCRYIDTRNVGGKVLPPAPPRGFDISQPGTVYGGAAECNYLTLSVSTRIPSAAWR